MIISRDINLLYPPFADQIQNFQAELIKAKLPFHIYMAVRTWEDQAELYAQGRTTPGIIVTKAKPGYSLHCYGLACDFVLDGMVDKPGIQWSWNTKVDLNADGRNDWLQMAEIAVSCGLQSGYYWKSFPDLPHVENHFGLTVNEMLEIYLENGRDIKAVWAACK